ncbi:8340_t:CDS:2 [Ambispora leptoticha]|uniref:8340_t:CDS:1 n=1 Tax=Ambispora leptoticha TaxID=144679 RepID=A0A9N8ZVB6_9GLOM|nr:8340_t:CDS:2 [Ambispora leptoticha]
MGNSKSLLNKEKKNLESKSKKILQTKSSSKQNQINSRKFHETDEDSDTIREDEFGDRHLFLQDLFECKFSVPIDSELLNGEAKILDIGLTFGLVQANFSDLVQNICSNVQRKSIQAIVLLRAIDTWIISQDFSFGHLDLNLDQSNPWTSWITLCGSGRWILEMANEYPLSQFFGIDIVNTYPTVCPKNVKFETRNILDGLTFADNSFDLVRIALMMTSLNEHEYYEVICDALRVLKPGKYIEIIDFLLPLQNLGPNHKTIYDAYESLYTARGINMRIAWKLESILETTKQIKDIKTMTRTAQMGLSGGKVGQLLHDVINSTFFDMFKIGVAAIVGMSFEQFENTWQTSLQEMVEHETFGVIKKAWGKKCVA